jgi:hypothetical protein
MQQREVTFDLLLRLTTPCSGRANQQFSYHHTPVRAADAAR